MRHRHCSIPLSTLVALSLCGAAAADAQNTASPAPKPPAQASPAAKPGAKSPSRSPSKPQAKVDHSGKRQVGKASFYARKFVGRPMANGKPYRAHDTNAASKTLPLGTVAKVTNLDNGQSTVVTIEDRGPYVDGRIVDLSPGSAQEIGLTPKQGVTPVEVAPIAVPQPDGSVKAGAGAGAGTAVMGAPPHPASEKE